MYLKIEVFIYPKEIIIVTFTVGLIAVILGFLALFHLVIKRQKFTTCTCSQAIEWLRKKERKFVEISGKIIDKKSIMTYPDPLRMAPSVEKYILEDKTGRLPLLYTSRFRKIMNVGDNIIVRGVLDTKDNVLTPLEIENLTIGEKTGKKSISVGSSFLHFWRNLHDVLLRI